MKRCSGVGFSRHSPENLGLATGAAGGNEEMPANRFCRRLPPWRLCTRRKRFVYKYKLF
ncbi:MAG: hypothetical protein IKW74_01965 [Thermoguttaceae bacterium]|nr:hypothetical protein [Thermoguttaceae bacterium]